MSTDAPVIKEVDLPDIPDKFSIPIELPEEQPEDQPVKVDM